MSIVLRYACLLGLGFASLFMFVSAGAVTGQMMLAGAHQSAAHPQDMSLWVLGGIAALGLISVMRSFVRFPIVVRDWFRDNKDRFATLAMACIVGFFFVVL